MFYNYLHMFNIKINVLNYSLDWLGVINYLFILKKALLNLKKNKKFLNSRFTLT